MTSSRLHYVSAVKALQRAYRDDILVDLADAEEALAEVQREVEAWREEIRVARDEVREFDLGQMVPPHERNTP